LPAAHAERRTITQKKKKPGANRASLTAGKTFLVSFFSMLPSDFLAGAFLAFFSLLALDFLAAFSDFSALGAGAGSDFGAWANAVAAKAAAIMATSSFFIRLSPREG
jgi:hypothetical protein